MQEASNPPLRRDPAGVDWAVAGLAGATTLFHLITARGYGIFRDELYYLACARHLAWGYVDHPPLVAALAWGVRHTIGTSLWSLRLIPALVAGGIVLLGAAIARHLGGGRFAQVLAGLAVALAPAYLGLLSVYSLNAVDLLAWSALLLLLVRILKDDDRRLWLLFGVIAGLGLENKVSVLFLGFGTGIGLLASRQWRQLREPRLWIGGAIAALLFAPHVAWQVTHGWPTLEFVRRATETKNVALSPAAFLARQVIMMNPVTAPLWLAGLGFFLLSRAGRPFRTLGWAYLAVLLVMLTQNAKPYYLAPFYPALLAAGAVVLSRVTAGPGRRALRVLSLVTVAITGALLAPLAKPLLPEDAYVRYASAFGMKPGTDERHRVGRLPQFFADMHGWKALAEAVARVHRSLPQGERGRACVFAGNYGEAGAIDLYGPALGLPPAISGHNNYWLWGPGDCDGQVMIVIGGNREDIAKSFAEVEEGGRFDCRDCMPYESRQTLWIARRLRHPIAEGWALARHFD